MSIDQQPESGDDESAYVPELKRGLEALYGPPHDITDAQLASFRRAFAEAQEESQTRQLSRLGEIRDPETYRYSQTDQAKVRLYEARVDRLAVAGVGIAGIIFGVIALVTGRFSPETLAGISLAITGLMLVALMIQSGRIGYLEKKSWNHVDDLKASLVTSVIRGHHMVHEAEAQLLRKARQYHKRRVLIVDVWNRPRRSTYTPEFNDVQNEALRYGREVADGRLDAAVGSRKENLDQCVELMRERLGVGANQTFFFENPLQFDVVITDDEAILSLPRRGTDRDFALHFRSPAVISELWDILEAQVGRHDDVSAQDVQSNDDIATVCDRVLSRSAPG